MFGRIFEISLYEYTKFSDKYIRLKIQEIIPGEPRDIWKIVNFLPKQSAEALEAFYVHIGVLVHYGAVVITQNNMGEE